MKWCISSLLLRRAILDGPLLSGGANCGDGHIPIQGDYGILVFHLRLMLRCDSKFFRRQFFPLSTTTVL